jgi:hypothetical protein
MSSTAVTIEQIEKVNVSMSQKINMGNYETRDIFVALELIRLPGQTPEEVIAFGKEICAKEVGDYYRAIKGHILGQKDVKPISDLHALILKAENKEQLETLRGKVDKLTEGKDETMKSFNLKLIELDEKSS